MSKITGIDISKQTFDCSITMADGKAVHKKFSNDIHGFEKLRSFLSEDSHVLMEASGAYYYKLAYYLHDHQIKVSVINPLVIRRFCQMRMERTKTDKKDAGRIREYGMYEQYGLWKPEDESIIKMKNISGVLDMIEKSINMFSNQLESYTQMPGADSYIIQQLNDIIFEHKERRKILEAELADTALKNYKTTYRALLSIPGIGPKSAAMLIAITGNFTKFKHYKELCAYVGLEPRISESGTSVKGRAYISKMGTARLRKLLYLCTWTARKANIYCREMYERLKAKAKPPMVISIALANKLLRQAFAVGTSLKEFDNNMKINLVD